MTNLESALAGIEQTESNKLLLKAFRTSVGALDAMHQVECLKAGCEVETAASDALSKLTAILTNGREGR